MSGNTALHYAVSQNNVAMVELLLQHNCDTGVLNKYNKFAKDIARSEKNKPIEIMLSKANAEQNVLGLKSSHSMERNYEQQSGAMQTMAIGTSKPQMAKVTTIMKLDNLSDETRELPPLLGYLDKRRNKAPHSWNKRWVIVAKPYILWDEKQIFIKEFGFSLFCFVTLYNTVLTRKCL